MKKNFLNFIKFSELSKQTKNKNALFLTSFFKILVVFSFFLIYFAQEELVDIWKTIFIFDLSVLFVSVIIGLLITSSRLSLSNIIAVLYAVTIRIYIYSFFLYIFFKSFAYLLIGNKVVSFTDFSIGNHLLFGALVLILVPMVFLEMDKNNQQPNPTS